MHESMNGKVVVVTGANAGLGLEISSSLARQGAHLVMACREPTRAEQARRKIEALAPHAQITSLPLDLSEPRSIRDFVDAYRARVGRVDILVHNAGVFGIPLARNSLGWELHWATNYLGPFLLTGLMLPAFEAGRRGRIVGVGSLAHRRGKVDLDDLDGARARYRPFAAYARSKLAFVTFTMELDRRLRARGQSVRSMGAHPGAVRTEIAKAHGVATAKSSVEEWLRKQIRARLATTEQAAQPILHAACSAHGVEGGAYYGPGGWFELKGETALARVNPRAKDRTFARKLWSATERVVGQSYLSEG